MKSKNDPAWVVESRLQAICEEALIEWNIKGTVTVDVHFDDDDDDEVCPTGDSY